MNKDFDGWNRHKLRINGTAQRSFYHPPEVWWCSVGQRRQRAGTGKEHDRPVLVLRGIFTRVRKDIQQRVGVLLDLCVYINVYSLNNSVSFIAFPILEWGIRREIHDIP
ncbi:MAG: hypothetical protein ACREMY_32715, partial [bacterium]